MATIPQHAGYQVIYGAGTGSNGDRLDVWVEYTTTQDINNNRSNVKAYFYAALHPGESSDTHGGDGCTSSFYVNGVKGSSLKSNGGFDFRSTSTVNTLGSFDGYVAHNENGTKTIAISASFTTTSSWITGGTLSGNIVLPTIPRGLFRANVGGVWKSCNVHVNVSGTWRQALAYANVSGTWKQGI
jgi:hypothetical protein